ncbi:MAG: DUF4012 domain-containing protein [bacterium]|nr:DUF4012 domain-containing protein [bacterium]
MRASPTILKTVLVLILVVVALGALVVLRSIPALATAAREASIAQDALVRASDLWEVQGIAGAHTAIVELTRARTTLARASERIEAQVFLSYVPIAGSVRVAAMNATRGAEHWVRGGHLLATIAADVDRLGTRFGGRSFRSLSDAEQAQITALVGSAALRLRTANAAFAAGDALLAQARCPRAVRRIVPQCASLDGALGSPTIVAQREQLRGVTQTATALVDSLGGAEPTSILLLFLNNTELRPGGGFLGTYGLAEVAGGSLTRFTTDDVYNLDREVVGEIQIAPPAPFREQGIVQYWYLRDANWSPDFAESSRTVLDFYEREHGPGNPEVVVGFTPTLAAALLMITGPITVEGVRFDAGNIADELEYQVEKAYATRGIPQPRRKDIIAPLSTAVIDRFYDIPLRELTRVLGALRAAVAERQLMAYSTNETFQHAFEQIAVAGRVAPIVHGEDFLMVVDANLGALKTDSVMDRRTTYAITPDAAGGYTGTVTLTYRNTGTFTWKTTRYQTYTRVYFPPGTRLYRVTGAATSADVLEELDRAAFGTFWSIEPGQTASLTFTVGLAPEIVARIRAGEYALHVQKQLGLPSPTTLTVDHEFGIPVETASPAEVPAAWGDGRYTVETDLRVDQRFRVRVAP